MEFLRDYAKGVAASILAASAVILICWLLMELSRLV
jgi:hypothetical protein